MIILQRTYELENLLSISMIGVSPPTTPGYIVTNDTGEDCGFLFKLSPQLHNIAIIEGDYPPFRFGVATENMEAFINILNGNNIKYNMIDG